MVFNSLKFVVFLFLIFVLYWTIPQKYRPILILVSSYVFISLSDIRYCIILLLVTIFTFISAIYISKSKKSNISKFILVLSITLCILILCSFKYLDVTNKIITNILGNDYILKEILLPVGISFYTLESISYLIDVFKEKIEPEKNFIYYACFLCFFPTVSCGPIEKANNIINQIKKTSVFYYEKVSYGLKLFAFGLFKKIVLADAIASHIDRVFEDVSNYYGFASILATVLYGIQIYTDFSGYSDMAIGVAKMFGIDIIDNFKVPYFSTTIKEFWSKWHISLSSWLKEYVYIPLGGNRCSKIRNCINLIFTFVISGMWHGSTANYLIWGLLHGLLQVIENLFEIKPVNRKYSFYWFARCGILYMIICIIWLTFRCKSISDVINILSVKHLMENSSFTNIPFYFEIGLKKLDIDTFTIIEIIFALLVVITYDYKKDNNVDIINKISNMKTVYRWTIYIAFCLCILFLSKKNVTESFIYMGF